MNISSFSKPILCNYTKPTVYLFISINPNIDACLKIEVYLFLPVSAFFIGFSKILVEKGTKKAIKARGLGGILFLLVIKTEALLSP